MIPSNLLRRLAMLEALRHPLEAEPRGMSEVLAWCRRHASMDDDDDPTRPLSGMSLLLAEAKEYMRMKGENHHGGDDPDDNLQ